LVIPGAPIDPSIHVPDAAVHVVLTSYNRGAYLQQALDSVLEQTFQDLHVLVVDDASDDGAAGVARDYERRFPERVTALCKPVRRGYVHSMNLGLAQLRDASLVAFQYDDDLWHPRKLEMQIQALADRPDAGLVATEALIIDEQGRAQGRLFSDIWGKPDPDRMAWHLFLHGNCLCAPSVVITRNALEFIEPYADSAGGCNDMDMWLAISSRMPILWLEEPLTYYRHSAQQMSNVRGLRMMRETYALRERQFNHSAAVRDAVGGDEARLHLDSHAVFWASRSLGRFDIRAYAWYAWRVIRRRRLRLALELAYFTLRALPQAVTNAVRLAARNEPKESD
jgi:glycosyltransferase involved in cell wall biosynthesis